MVKYLLSQDYEEIINTALQIPYKDLYRYYKNIYEEHYSTNNDLFDNLFLSLRDFFQWAEKIRNDISSKENILHFKVDEQGNSYLLMLKDNGLHFRVEFDSFCYHQEAIEKVKEEQKRVQSTNALGAKSNKVEGPASLDEIFYNSKMIEPCIDVLRQIDPPIINSNLDYIGRNKTLIVVWIQELKIKRFIKSYGDKTYASLVNQKFSGLNMTKDGSLFRKNFSRAEKKRIDFSVLISQISQTSHFTK